MTTQAEHHAAAKRRTRASLSQASEAFDAAAACAEQVQGMEWTCAELWDHLEAKARQAMRAAYDLEDALFP
jgi:hypothetical protein